MPYDCNIENRGDHIRVEISGERVRGKEVDDIIRVLFEVIEFCRNTGISRILAISKLNGRIPTLTAFNITESLKKIGWEKNFKLANVIMDNESKEDSRFGETVALNRGFPYRVFDNEQDAKMWLLQ